LEMALTGEPLTADRAAHFGLVNQVVDDGGALAAAVELARRIARNGPLAIAATKRVIQDSRDWPASEAFERQQPISEAVRASDDAREGARAFAEKRKPVWRNR
jgi:enoyl-CoA hydratase